MIINKPALSAALKMVAPVISNNPIIPAHSGVKITDKYLTAGNSGISVAIPVSLGIPECVLDYSILSKAVFGLSGEIDLTADDKVAVLKSTEGKVNVPVICQPNEYPAMNQEFKHEDFTLSAEDIASVAQLANFAHFNPGAPYWQGVLYDGETFNAFDGIIFANFSKNTSFDKQSIFPKDLFKVLQNMGADTYEFTRGMVIAKSGDNVIAYVKYLLVNEGFPNVKNFINGLKFSKATSISQDNLAKSFDLLSISTDDATQSIELQVEPDNGITGITGKEEINTLSEIEIESVNDGLDERMQISFNFNRLAKGLKYLGGSSVKMELDTPKSPVRVQSDVEGRSIVLAPLA